MIHLRLLLVTYAPVRLIRNAATAFFFVSLPVLALPAQAEPVTLVALGDSLTAGYGLPPDQGLVPQLQSWLTAQGAEVTVVNAGVSGDTTAGGLSRLDWSLTPETDALMVTLGGNDMLRGVPPEEARANLTAISTPPACG
jgi:acyl-CoA thioesterase-1